MRTNKTIGLFALAIFAVVITMSFMSATNGFSLAVSGVGSSSNPVTGAVGSIQNATVTLTNTNASSVYVTWSGVSPPLSLPSNGTVYSGSTNYNVGVNITSSGSYHVLTADFYNASNHSQIMGSDSVNVYYSVKSSTPTKPSSFCSNGTVGDLYISHFNIDNINGDNSQWQPLDNVEVSVDVKNENNTDSINSVYVDMKIVDGSGQDVTDNFNLNDNSISLGSIGHGKTKTATFKMPELPADIQDGTYEMYIKAYSNDNENMNCVDNSSKFNDNAYQSFDVYREYDEQVVIKDFNGSATLNAGQQFPVNYDIYNTGTIDESDVLVEIQSPQLGITQFQHLHNLDSGEHQTVSFTPTIPSNVTSGQYDFYTTLYFNYNDGDILNPTSYDSDSRNDLNTNYDTIITVNNPTPQTTISASLVSGGTAGKDLVVQGVITNTGSSTQTYTVSASGFTSWANSFTVDQPTVTVAAGQSKDVTFTFPVNSDVSGTQTFDLEAVSGTDVVSQPVQVQIQPSSSLFGNFNSNTLVWILGALVIILLIIVIIVAVKVSKR